ncbi:MAG: hypothetical protein BAJALOKI2v1_520024 [Promethearchaeota archaeon]|nr:MAG: hypothetical protein BAJALOKI2v1_520024 [Candidatus Lokiarchaeota archaeon]
MIGVTNKRSFYYYRDNRFLIGKKKSEEFLSSKFPIPSIKYKLWSVPLWG